MKYIIVTRKLYLITIVAIGFCLMTFAYGVVKYRHLKNSITNSAVLESTMQRQQAVMDHQQSRLKAIDSELYQFKQYIDDVENFEDQVITANRLGKKFDRIRLNGVGGPTSGKETTGGVILRRQQIIDEISEQLLELQQASQNKIESLQKLLPEVERQMAIPSIRPAQGWISSRYGYRKSPFTGRRHFHRGVDIANYAGTPILAAASGKIIKAGVEGLFGRTILIDHQNGFQTRYAHLDKILKRKGTLVRKGEMIARMGNTGRSTGPHLHYEVHRNGKSLNPIRYIKQRPSRNG